MPIIQANWHFEEIMASGSAAKRAFQSVENVLGGESVLGVKARSSLDWISVIREGIPVPAVEAVLDAVHLTQAELARTLGIPERTLARRKREGTLNSEESAKLLRLARVISRARDVFGEPAAAVDWLKSPNAALRGSAPLDLIDTEIGAEAVLDTLGRIEHGVFA